MNFWKVVEKTKPISRSTELISVTWSKVLVGLKKRAFGRDITYDVYIHIHMQYTC